MSGVEFGRRGRMVAHDCDCEFCTEFGSSHFRQGNWFAKCCGGWSIAGLKAEVVGALTGHLRDAHSIEPDHLVASIAEEHGKCGGGGCKDCDGGISHRDETVGLTDLSVKAGAA